MIGRFAIWMKSFSRGDHGSHKLSCTYIWESVQYWSAEFVNKTIQYCTVHAAPRVNCTQVILGRTARTLTPLGEGLGTGGYTEMSSYLIWPIAPSYMSPNGGGGGCGVSANEYNCTRNPNKLWGSNSIFNLCLCMMELGPSPPFVTAVMTVCCIHLVTYQQPQPESRSWAAPARAGGKVRQTFYHSTNHSYRVTLFPLSRAGRRVGPSFYDLLPLWSLLYRFIPLRPIPLRWFQQT